jgi:hypothetical protein
MQKKQNIRSFEGDFYYFDIIWTLAKAESTFEIRATSAENGATATVTNNNELKTLLLDGATAQATHEQPIWKITADKAEAFAQKAISIFSNDKTLAQMEEAMNDDYATGRWMSEDQFGSEELGFDDDDEEDDFLFDDAGQEDNDLF